MAFSRKQIVKADFLNIAEVVYELEDVISPLIGEGIELQIDIKSEIGSVFADKTQLNQVILNLIVNAKDALDEKDISNFEKWIRIEIDEVFLDEKFVLKNPGSCIGNNVSISIIDNGVGIKSENLDKIFEPFFTTKKRGKGTGLGLSTAYGIVKQNKGYIYAKSDFGNWTRVTTLWPMIEDELYGGIKKEENKSLENNKLKVLVVEDEESVRDFVVEILKDNGCTVYEAENGALALEKIRDKEVKIDCILSDIVMPVMDGGQLAEIVSKEYPNIKIILMSGYTDSNTLLNKIKEKDYSFIKKPFAIDELLRLVLS